MHVDVAEGHVAGEAQAHHHHARHPEEQDVARRREDVGGIERAQLGRVVRPAERRERPQRAGEPRVEHVGVAHPTLALGRLEPRIGVLAAIPDGDLVAPPQLPRDGPVVDVVHPAEEFGAPVLGHESHVVDVLDDFVRERLRLHEPLLAEERLDDVSAALALAQRHRVRLGSALEAELGKPRLQLRSHFYTIYTFERPGILVQRAVEVEDVDQRQLVPLAGLEVLEAVARRDLHRAGAELGIDQLRVGDDRELAAQNRVAHVPADHRLVARIVRMNGHRGVAEHRLDARGGDDDFARAVGERIREFVQLALHALFVIDLEVAQSRAVFDAPVDQPLGAIK